MLIIALQAECIGAEQPVQDLKLALPAKEEMRPELTLGEKGAAEPVIVSLQPVRTRPERLVFLVGHNFDRVTIDETELPFVEPL